MIVQPALSQLFSWYDGSYPQRILSMRCKHYGKHGSLAVRPLPVCLGWNGHSSKRSYLEPVLPTDGRLAVEASAGLLGTQEASNENKKLLGQVRFGSL